MQGQGTDFEGFVGFGGGWTGFERFQGKAMLTEKNGFLKVRWRVR